MSRRRRIWSRKACESVVTSALLLGVVACGETRNNLDSGGSGADSGEGAGGERQGKGGQGAGASPGDASPGNGAAAGEGPTGASAGEPDGSIATGMGAAGAGAGGGSGSTSQGGPGGTDPGSSVIDTHADERQRVANDFCAVLEKYPCLTYEAGGLSQTPGADAPIAERVAACEQDTNLAAYSLVGEACWAAWVAAATCQATKIPHACPCGNDCTLRNTFAGTLDTPCDPEAAALNACVAKVPAGTVTGKRAQCSWQADAPGSCFDECTAKDFQFVDARCSGPPGGPFRCPCLMNGRLLLDDATGQERWFVADSCQAAAQQMADGECFDGLNCCFTWKSSDGQDECSCTADPTQAMPDGTPGFSSCAAAAAAGHGKVVDVCPKYAPNTSDYPQH